MGGWFSNDTDFLHGSCRKIKWEGLPNRRNSLSSSSPSSFSILNIVLLVGGCGKQSKLAFSSPPALGKVGKEFMKITSFTTTKLESYMHVQEK